MKDITEKDQFKIVNLVNKNKMKEAYELERKFNNQGFFVMEDVNRIQSAQNAGSICYKNKSATPFWVKNNKYLEQSFSFGWKSEQSKDSI